MVANTILVSEIFGPTLQGEGALIGRPTVFVRTGACDYRCSWCDTLFAVLPEYRHEWRPLTAPAILGEVLRCSQGQPILVTISGGNPALQPLDALLDTGRSQGLSFALETQGSLARAWFAKLDYLVLSPKPPSSGMQFDPDGLAACLEAAANGPQTVFKVVVFGESDYEFARRVHASAPQVPMFLQVGTDQPADKAVEAAQALGDRDTGVVARAEWLLARVVADGWRDVVILPQLHVLLWGHRRGV